jgi:hypothetical protein
MSRYTGPRARVSRRLGTNIWGTNGENIAMEKRPYPPGEHGRTRRRGNVSEYLLQLQEKQKARFAYGMTEKQFRNLYEEANRRQGVTGENLLRYCEQRLDNVVYRATWAATRPQARQFVTIHVGDEVHARATGAATGAQRLHHHARPQVGAADADVDDVGDGAVGTHRFGKIEQIGLRNGHLMMQQCYYFCSFMRFLDKRWHLI